MGDKPGSHLRGTGGGGGGKLIRLPPYTAYLDSGDIEVSISCVVVVLQHEFRHRRVRQVIG